jgi:large subunit ribosomal protein L35
MPKIKTKKTLTRRIKITGTGKIMKKQNNMGHLNVKLTASKKTRKRKMTEQAGKGQRRVIKQLLGSRGGKLK